MLDQGYGIEGFGGVSAVQPLYDSAGAEEKRELRGVRLGVVRVVGEVPLVLQADGELELQLDGREEGVGGEAQGNFQRGRHSDVGEWPAS